MRYWLDLISLGPTAPTIQLHKTGKKLTESKQGFTTRIYRYKKGVAGKVRGVDAIRVYQNAWNCRKKET